MYDFISIFMLPCLILFFITTVEVWDSSWRWRWFRTKARRLKAKGVSSKTVKTYIRFYKMVEDIWKKGGNFDTYTFKVSKLLTDGLDNEMEDPKCIYLYRYLIILYDYEQALITIRNEYKDEDKDFLKKAESVFKMLYNDLNGARIKRLKELKEDNKVSVQMLDEELKLIKEVKKLRTP